ncbi:MAG TPA: YceI family protein [Thermoanaerobaculia bacterium]|nr:YceI family protein [Thermoanaerobaculia bacterium]
MHALLLTALLLTASPSSEVVLDGSSNVADWRCRGTSIDAEMTVATTAAHLNEVIDRVEDGNIGVWMAKPELGRFPAPEFQLTIPVTAFRCGNRVMESDMRNALKAERHPNVAFRFRALRGGVQHDLDSGLYHAAIVGDLTLAGVTRTIDVQVSAERLSRTSFRVRAVLPLRMTDFAITPPSALFGAIRARNSLTVRFDLILNVRQS